LVLIGATAEGKKELVGFQTGVRESAQSWRELPLRTCGSVMVGLSNMMSIWPATRSCTAAPAPR